MKTASATEVKNRFGEFIESVQREPVTVEKTGRPCMVLLSIQDFERLQAYEDAYWGRKAEEAAQNGYLSPDETMAKIRQRLDAIERGEE